jgi:menaquinol-cytochrome c reductase iron-sulfur subunit
VSVQTSRRKFYQSLISALSGVAAAIVAIPAAAYLFAKPKSPETAEWVEIGDVRELPVGRPEEIVYRRTRIDGWRRISEKTTAWVVRTGGDNVIAFAPACTHLGCAYRWEESAGYFLCPCHTSTFSTEGGVLSGPAPRPLDRYAVKVDRGKILVGSEVIERT